MFQTRLLGGVVFSLSLTLPSHRHVEEPVVDTNVFYVGLGDQFDDDRRLVREPESAPAKAGANGYSGLRRR